TLVGTGTVLSKAAEATAILKGKGIHPRLINLHTVKPLDRDLILKAAAETGRIVTVEDGFLAGGMVSAIAELLAKEHPTPMKMSGLDDEYAETGPYEELLGLYGLQGAQIAETVEGFLG
ncbi:MAG: transketolase family protein, partial [Deltaproteobacteria bacterium]|nr:transketolase family protein [Deltaproteobacteria bacterium]